MKKLFVLLTALFTLAQMDAQEKNVIRIATDNTDLILQVAPNGRLYQAYLGDKLLNEKDINNFSPYITENRARVSIIVRDCYSRFKIILGAGARIYFPSTGRYTAVTSSFHVWRKVVDVFLVQQLIAQISLIKSSVGSYLEN